MKAALFATGLSGIVAEYILSTLATYFLGDSVFQWTMVLSMMLFAMGLGSRISKYMDKHLFERFIIIEFALSLLASFCALITYQMAAYTDFLHILIYGLAVLVGLFIGMEIPLVMRINNEYEALKVNISAVMEKDYFGSLAGGLFFAFVGVPYLGLTYTPFVLGSINFLVAVVLYWRFRDIVHKPIRIPLAATTVLVFLMIGAGTYFAEPIIRFGEQKRYTDKVIFSKLTRYQQIVVTQFKEYYWLYLNSHQQLSTLDEHLYHEPLVHPPMKLAKAPQDVLILGGGDGCAVREVLKYPTVKSVTLIDLDSVMTNMGKYHPIFRSLNKEAFFDEKVKVINTDAFTHLADVSTQFWDVIIIDFPDPRNIELNRLYTLEFYRHCRNHLRPNGVMITQAGSPYYAAMAFRSVEKTMRAAGLNVIPLHNQVLTMGEWGWVMGSRSVPEDSIKGVLQQVRYDDIETQWINNEAMKLITSFGKEVIKIDTARVEVNKVHDPVLYRLYNDGQWSMY